MLLTVSVFGTNAIPSEKVGTRSVRVPDGDGRDGVVRGPQAFLKLLGEVLREASSCQFSVEGSTYTPLRYRGGPVSISYGRTPRFG